MFCWGRRLSSLESSCGCGLCRVLVDLWCRLCRQDVHCGDATIGHGQSLRSCGRGYFTMFCWGRRLSSLESSCGCGLCRVLVDLWCRLCRQDVHCGDATIGHGQSL